MHLYLRIIRNQGPESYTIAEERELRAGLSLAPGLDLVKELQRHPRGGYAVTLERTGAPLEPWLERLAAAGFRAAI